MTSGVDSRVVLWVREFLVGHIQRVTVGGQLSKDAKVTSGVLQGSTPEVNDFWRNIDLDIRLLADDCIIYRKITNKNDI